MAEEAKDSPSKGGTPPCEYPEGALDLLKKLTEGVPLYILVITDPFSHMLWLQPITTKAPEEVYKKFVENFLLEEGAPQFILTDRGIRDLIGDDVSQ